MLLEPELAEPLAGVDAQDVLRRLARIQRKQNRNQAADDVGVAVADKGKARLAAALLDTGGEPNLADAALHLVRGGVFRLGQGRKPAAELDDVAVAILPVAEKVEIGQDLVEAGIAPRGAKRVHVINIGGKRGNRDGLARKKLSGAPPIAKSRDRPRPRRDRRD